MAPRVPAKFNLVAGSGKLDEQISASDVKAALVLWQKQRPDDLAEALIGRLMLALNHIKRFKLSLPVVKTVWKLVAEEMVR